MKKLRLVGVKSLLEIVVVMLAAACSTKAMPPVTSSPPQTMSPQRTPAVVQMSPTNTSQPSPTPIPVPDRAFPHTEAWLLSHSRNEFGFLFDSAEQRKQLVDIFTAEVMMYLEQTITPTIPLEYQAPALAQMAADMPACSWCPLQSHRASVMAVDLDAADAELLIVPKFEGAPLLYARHLLAGWQTIPVSVNQWRGGWGHEVVNDEALFAYSAEAGDVTGDGQTEVVTVHGWHSTATGDNVKYLQIWRWGDEEFSLLFRAAVTKWAMGLSDWHFIPYGAGQDVVITYSGPKDFNFSVKETNRWRWDAATDHYVLWATAVYPLLWNGHGTRNESELLGRVELGTPVQVLQADLDGDEQAEMVWSAELLGFQGEGTWYMVWVGWQDESSDWQATGIAASGALTLESVTPSGEPGGGSIVIRHDGERQVYWWDDELKMARIPPAERPDEWPEY